MNKKKLFIAILCILITFLLIINYYVFSFTPFDDLFYKLIIKLKHPVVTRIFILFTYVGGVIGTIVLIGIVVCANRRRGLYFLFNILIISIINFVLKNIFMRERPIGINIIDETGYSFPSGHAMTAIAAYGLILYYLYRSKMNKKLRHILIVLTMVMIVVIPISRVYLGVHFFSDITLGACISITWLMFYTEYLNNKDI